MDKFKFAPAQPGEQIVFGAQRPGYPGRSVSKAEVDEWISFMKHQSIARVCCLLGASQLAYYQQDLLARYRHAFSEQHVSSAPIADYTLCQETTLENDILPFLVSADSAGARTVVHCSGGSGRTGHVLAAWLVRRRGLQPEAAIQVVTASGRNPHEAVQCGHASEDQLHQLLAGNDRKLGGSVMTNVEKTRIAQLVGKLRASHDELGRLIESKQEALRLLDRARDELSDLVTAYEDALDRTSKRA